MSIHTGTARDGVLRVTDERLVACLDQPVPDLGAVWELCVRLEWDRASALAGITRWLGPPDGQRILDCACGSGFPAIDLVALGYDVTCSDGSRRMLAYFRRNARRAGVGIEAVLAPWERLVSRVGGGFDVVMCRGSSLPYAGTWDRDGLPDRAALAEALRQFVACLRPGGRLYVDITLAEDLARLEPQWTRHPTIVAGDHVVQLDECLTTDVARRIRVWRTWLRLDGRTHRFERRSHYLPHADLVRLLRRVGLTDVRRAPVDGERYAVFVGTRG